MSYEKKEMDFYNQINQNQYNTKFGDEENDRNDEYINILKNADPQFKKYMSNKMKKQNNENQLNINDIQLNYNPNDESSEDDFINYLIEGKEKNQNEKNESTLKNQIIITNDNSSKDDDEYINYLIEGTINQSQNNSEIKNSNLEFNDEIKDEILKSQNQLKMPLKAPNNNLNKIQIEEENQNQKEKENPNREEFNDKEIQLSFNNVFEFCPEDIEKKYHSVEFMNSINVLIEEIKLMEKISSLYKNSNDDNNTFEVFDMKKKDCENKIELLKENFENDINQYYQQILKCMDDQKEILKKVDLDNKLKYKNYVKKRINDRINILEKEIEELKEKIAKLNEEELKEKIPNLNEEELKEKTPNLNEEEEGKIEKLNEEEKEGKITKLNEKEEKISKQNEEEEEEKISKQNEEEEEEKISKQNDEEEEEKISKLNEEEEDRKKKENEIKETLEKRLNEYLNAQKYFEDNDMSEIQKNKAENNINEIEKLKDKINKGKLDEINLNQIPKEIDYEFIYGMTIEERDETFSKILKDLKTKLKEDKEEFEKLSSETNKEEDEIQLNLDNLKKKINIDKYIIKVYTEASENKWCPSPIIKINTLNTQNPVEEDKLHIKISNFQCNDNPKNYYIDLSILEENKKIKIKDKNQILFDDNIKCEKHKMKFLYNKDLIMNLNVYSKKCFCCIVASGQNQIGYLEIKLNDFLNKNTIENTYEFLDLEKKSNIGKTIHVQLQIAEALEGNQDETQIEILQVFQPFKGNPIKNYTIPSLFNNINENNIDSNNLMNDEDNKSNENEDNKSNENENNKSNENEDNKSNENENNKSNEYEESENKDNKNNDEESNMS